MGFEIINRVLEELNREEYRRRFIAKSMDDEAMGAIVDDASFCFIIQKIVPRRDHAIQIQNKFKELWSCRNESESNAPRSRSSSAGSNGSTDSLFAVTIIAARETPVPSASSAENESPPAPAPAPAPGPSTRARPNDEHDRYWNQNRYCVRAPTTNQLSLQNAEEEENSVASEFASFDTRRTRVERKRIMPDSPLDQPQRNFRKTCKCTRAHLHGPTRPTQEETGTRSSSESE